MPKIYKTKLYKIDYDTARNYGGGTTTATGRYILTEWAHFQKVLNAGGTITRIN